MRHLALIAFALGCTTAIAACSSQTSHSQPDGGPSCDNVRTWRLMIVCAQPALERVGDTFRFDQTATVTHWGTGLEGCYPAGGLPDIDPSSVHILTLRTAAGAEQSIGFVLEGVSPTVAVGATAHVTYTVEGGGFAPTLSRFQMDGAQGDLILYVGIGARPEQMTPPRDLTLSLGQQLCSAGGCGPWGRFEIVASMPGELGADGAQTMTRTLTPASGARLGPYFIALGESEQQTAGELMCLDWFVSQTTVVVTP